MSFNFRVYDDDLVVQQQLNKMENLKTKPVLRLLLEQPIEIREIIARQTQEVENVLLTRRNRQIGINRAKERLSLACINSRQVNRHLQRLVVCSLQDAAWDDLFPFKLFFDAYNVYRRDLSLHKRRFILETFDYLETVFDGTLDTDPTFALIVGAYTEAHILLN